MQYSIVSIFDINSRAAIVKHMCASGMHAYIDGDINKSK